MTTYIMKRLLSIIPTMLGVAVLVFLMIHMIPGDPARAIGGMEADAEALEAIRRDLGLHEPLHLQFADFLGGAVRGDFGRSFSTGAPVTGEIFSRMPYTLQLALAGITLSVSIGLISGVIAATHHQRPLDNIVMVAAMFGVSMPSFWFGLMLIVIFAVSLGWFPTSGSGSLAHLVLPAMALGIRAAAILARLTRSSMLDVMKADYVRTARGKGLGESVIILKHVLRNSLIPVVTVVGLQFGALLAGTVIIEQVFAWPGIGRLLIRSLMARDFPMVQGTILYIALAFVLVNLVVDLFYSVLDPRIQYN